MSILVTVKSPFNVILERGIQTEFLYYRNLQKMQIYKFSLFANFIFVFSCS